MLTTFKSTNISQALSLVPSLLKSVEKAVSQSNQPLSVSEGLCAALLLIKVSGSKSEKENGLSSMWASVLDMDKQIFVSEKFLQAANETSKYNVYLFYLLINFILQVCLMLLN